MRAGVIGAGGIAPEHLQVLAARSDVELVGVADRSAATARWAAERWGATGWFTDHRALLDAGVDVVHVLTPPSSHVSIARDALAAGAHVLVEKPVAPTVAELEELHDLAEASGRWLQEDQNYRFNDSVLWLADQVHGERLGAARDVEVAMALPIRAGGAFADPHLPSPAHRLPAGALHDFLPHLCYLGLLFAPGLQEPDEVRVVWSNHGGDDGLWRHDDLDAVLVRGPVHLRLRFSAQTAPDRFQLTVRGTEGDASVELFQPSEQRRVPRAAGQQLTPLINQAVAGAGLIRQTGRNFRDKVAQHTPYHGLHRFVDRCYDAVRDGTSPPVSWPDLRASTQLLDVLLAADTRGDR